MSDNRSLSGRWSAYQPSKGVWFWSVAGAVIATMIIGFGFGGWTTGGTAENMATQAASTARMELAASLCVTKFASDNGAAQQLVALKEAKSWERDDFINDGGWAQLPGTLEPVKGAADLCATKLVAMENIPESTLAVAPAGG